MSIPTTRSWCSIILIQWLVNGNGIFLVRTEVSVCGCVVDIQWKLNLQRGIYSIEVSDRTLLSYTFSISWRSPRTCIVNTFLTVKAVEGRRALISVYRTVTERITIDIQLSYKTIIRDDSLSSNVFVTPTYRKERKSVFPNKYQL